MTRVVFTQPRGAGNAPFSFEPPPGGFAQRKPQ
jgi:hypothetical protein